MKKQIIAKEIRKALTSSAPDKFNEILLNCEMKGKIAMKEEKTSKVIKRYSLKFSMALAVIVLTLGLTYFNYKETYKIDSIIELDVNPSIEIKMNKKEKVIEVIAKNEDAKKVLKDMDLEKTDIDVALNAIIGSMITKGYIDDLSNSVLLTIEAKNSEKSEKLRQKLTDKINSILDNDKMKGSILSQKINNKDKEINELSKKYNISLGKAALLKDVLDSNKLLTEKDLADLSINDLNVLSESKNAKLTKVEKKGTASVKGYIGKEKAKQIALKDAGVNSPKNLEIDFDADDGIIVYEIEFAGSKYEYDYEINAKTGKIFKKDKEINEDYVEKNNYDNPDKNKGNNSQTNNTDKNQNTYISASKAKQIAFSHAKVTNPNNVQIELDREDNEYQIEFNYSGYEYDYEINAKTGIIKDYDKERIDND